MTYYDKEASAVNTLKEYVPQIYCKTKFVTVSTVIDGIDRVVIKEVADISDGTNLHDFKRIYSVLKKLDSESKQHSFNIKGCILTTQVLFEVQKDIERVFLASGFVDKCRHEKEIDNEMVISKFTDPNLEALILLSTKSSCRLLKNSNAKTIPPSDPMEAISNLSAEIFEGDKKRWAYSIEMSALIMSDTNENEVEVNDNFYHILSDLTMYAYNICKLFDTICTQTRTQMTQITKK